jgi:hypothetical protein
MTASPQLVALAKKRLADIDHEREELEAERNDLLALLRRYGVADGGSARENGKSPHRVRHSRVVEKAKGTGRPKPTSRHRTLAQQRGARPFRRMDGGPTDAILDALRKAPQGLRYSEVLQGAAETVQSHATDPTKSLGSVLTTLRKRGKVAYRDGKYYSPLE